jgi:AraC-like DNA-binding protein
MEATQGNDEASVEHPLMTFVADQVAGGLPECKLRRVTQYVKDNLHRELRLAELSSLVHMSPYHFARVFKRSTGVSPHRFLVRRRIEEASALLAAQTLPIAEIARSVGFRTASHFTTTFRRVTGITPSVYRSCGEAEPVRRIPIGRRHGHAGPSSTPLHPGTAALPGGWLSEKVDREQRR